jgi:hypothetical protein
MEQFKSIHVGFLVMLLWIGFPAHAGAADDAQFETEAKSLVADLKGALVQNLSQKIEKDGLAAAVPFCHENVKQIAKGAAKDRMAKYQFGRTSHKVRNPENSPQSWMNPYLKEFEGKSMGEAQKTSILHRFSNGKRAYLEPLYVQAKCLLCHGEVIPSEVKAKVKSLYPADRATGFKLNEFRGFVWVKEK